MIIEGKTKINLKMSDLPHKHIGVAIIVNQDKQILIDKRLPTGLMANLWEFPGGKIEEGETVIDCIEREIKEELGIDIKVNEHLIDINHTYSQFFLTLSVYFAQIIAGIPQSLECAEIRWVKANELPQFEFPEANQIIIQRLTEIL
jgi:mutator protein MutT